MKKVEMNVIAHIENDFKGKFAVPRQSGLSGVKSKIVFEKEYRNPDSLRGIEGYSHLWLIWNFSMSESGGFKPTVRPPRLGGNTRMGVFATRSPYRPNPVGLSSVELVEVDRQNVTLTVSGADLADGTPIFDIKPYLAFTDSHPDAKCGFADEVKEYSLKVEIPDELLKKLSEEKKTELVKILSGDPRPSYQDDENRIYGFEYGEYSVKFKVKDEILTVVEIKAFTE